MIDKETEDKIMLCDSDDEEEEENYADDFKKVRPQYEGPHASQMFEMNSQLSKRFQLDERFAEDFEPEVSEKPAVKDSSDEDERQKNIRILENVLGHEVRTNSADKKFSRKRLIRYDPEDENASKYEKVQEDCSEKTKKSKKKKEKKDEVKTEEPIPVSTERYIEVCPDLKEILTTSTPFSFSQKFNFNGGNEMENDAFPKITEKSFIEEVVEENVDQEFENEKNGSFKYTRNNQISRPNSFQFKSKSDRFFISKDDPRLKEGIEFFKRPKPLEELRVEWQKKKEHVQELFRRKWRSSQRSHTTKVKTIQYKNAIRNRNFKK